ncbi:hypothetical protein KI387_013901, partial [Taxus chinensis]
TTTKQVVGRKSVGKVTLSVEGVLDTSSRMCKCLQHSAPPERTFFHVSSSQHFGRSSNSTLITKIEVIQNEYRDAAISKKYNYLCKEIDQIQMQLQ